jgi:thermitase
MSHDPRIRRWIAVGTILVAAILAGCGENDAPSGPDPGPGPGPGPGPPGSFEPAQVLARLASGVEVATIHARYGTTTLEAIESQRVYLLALPEETTVEEALPVMQADSDLDGASPNGRLGVPEAQSRSTMAFADPSLERADRDDQEAIRRIRAREAWGDSRGDGVIVAVLDTGVDPGHPQLAGRIADGGADLVDGDADFSDLPDGVDSDEDGLVDEALGHGTFVAGLVLSVAPDAEVLPIRILDSDGTGQAVDIARGIELAVDRGARVVNLSLGMEIESEVLQQVIEEEAREKGIAFVASAGNRDSDQRQYPAGQNEVVGVAATDPGDGKADFSNWGSWVSISAPGVGLVSLLPAAAMGRWSGTSFASALATGEAAILIAFAPFARADEVRDAIEDSAEEVSDPRLTGAGRIDVEAAVRLLEERLGLVEVETEVEIAGLVVSVDLLARTIRLDEGTRIEVPHDGVIEGSGDFVTLSAVAVAVGLGLPIRADGLAIDEDGDLRAIEIRFELDT